eukprot:scaffold1999_cov119-Isochrysis_galbana.AAC.2
MIDIHILGNTQRPGRTHVLQWPVAGPPARRCSMSMVVRWRRESRAGHRHTAPLDPPGYSYSPPHAMDGERWWVIQDQDGDGPTALCYVPPTAYVPSRREGLQRQRASREMTKIG